jgi:hypothetical protein
LENLLDIDTLRANKEVTTLNLSKVEQYFQNEQKLMGNFADEHSFNMIYSLIEQVRQLRKENDKLCLLNRHYYNKFYPGDIEKMEADFNYLLE